MPKRRTSQLTPKLAFDGRTGRYHEKDTGRFVKQAFVVKTLEGLIADSRSHIETIAGDLKSGKLTLREWRTDMLQTIKTVHTAEYAVANGGWYGMTQSMYGRLGNVLKVQYAYLNNFVTEIQQKYDSAQDLDGRFTVRAQSYADAGRATYQQARREQQMRAGMTEEKRVLESGAKHCATCLSEAAKGWRPIGTLKTIGDSECQVGCQCEWATR